jgi:glycosyltransferase involved in cell wall biosynthesis
MGLSGVQRTLKFVKYLSLYGWNSIVLTTTADTPYYAFDESLLEEIQPLIDAGTVTIYRTDGDPTIGKSAAKKGRDLVLPSHHWQSLRKRLVQAVRQPDSRIKWKEFALKKADEIFADHSIDAVFSTAPPYTDFLIAKEIKEKFQVPYIMDYRDGWVDNPILNHYLTGLHRKKARTMEYECLRASDSITVANRRMKEILLQNYSFLDWNDVHILPHGYDPEDITAAEPRAEELRDDKIFRLTYSGAFYPGRSPKPLMQAAAQAIADKPELRGCLELSIIGLMQKEYKKFAKKIGIESVVKEYGYLPHRESLAHLLASDVLWITIHEDYSAPGKMYEYFGTRKPILGLVPMESHTARLLREYGNVLLCEYNDVDAIRRAILEYYDRWKKWELSTSVTSEILDRYDRRTITKELARQLTFISGSTDGEIKRLRMK